MANLDLKSDIIQKIKKISGDDKIMAEFLVKIIELDMRENAHWNEKYNELISEYSLKRGVK